MIKRISQVLLISWFNCDLAPQLLFLFFFFVSFSKNENNPQSALIVICDFMENVNFCWVHQCCDNVIGISALWINEFGWILIPNKNKTIKKCIKMEKKWLFTFHWRRIAIVLSSQDEILSKHFKSPDWMTLWIWRYSFNLCPTTDNRG